MSAVFVMCCRVKLKSVFKHQLLLLSEGGPILSEGGPIFMLSVIL